MRVRNHQQIVALGGNDYGDYSFMTCGNCGRFALYDNENCTICLNPHDLKTDCRLYALTNIQPVACPGCGKEDSFDDADDSDLAGIAAGDWAFALEEYKMEPLRIAAYRYIASQALLELKWQAQRCCNVIPVFAGFSRRHKKQLHCISHLSAAFHNLAIALLLPEKRMDIFPEHDFWDGIRRLQDQFGDLLMIDYRRSFDQYLNGKEMASPAGGPRLATVVPDANYRRFLSSCEGLDTNGLQISGHITGVSLNVPDGDRLYRSIRRMLLQYDWKGAVRNERFRSFSEDTVQWLCLYRADGSASIVEISFHGELWLDDGIALLIPKVEPEEAHQLLPHLKSWSPLIPGAKLPNLFEPSSPD